MKTSRAPDPNPPRSRPEWAKGGGPLIAGPSAGKGWDRPGRHPRVPSNPEGGPDPRHQALDDAAQVGKDVPSWKSGGRLQMGLVAAALVLLAAAAGLVGGRLGRGSGVSPAGQPAAVPPPAQAAPAQPSIPSATLSQIYEKVAPSVVQIVPAAGGPGAAVTGLILDEEGTILTTNEVAAGGDLSVVLANGQEVPAKVAGTDPEKNLAALRLSVPVPGLVAAELGNSESVAIGDPVAAIGAPFGLQQTLTSGVVSALKRNFAGAGKTPPLKDLIQSDAPINTGGFGGPLVNEAGEVVGINMAIQSPVGAFVGVGFAVPINQAKSDLLERIQEV